MASEIFKKDMQIDIPITKPLNCLQTGKLQHTSKPGRDAVEVLKFRCRQAKCPQLLGEVVAGVRGETLDEALKYADVTASFVRRFSGCAAPPIVKEEDLC